MRRWITFGCLLLAVQPAGAQTEKQRLARSCHHGAVARTADAEEDCGYARSRKPQAGDNPSRNGEDVDRKVPGRCGRSRRCGDSSGLARAEDLAARAERLVEDGEYDAAVPLARQSLAIRERALGDRHPDVARALYLLGEVRGKLGDYAGATSVLERALAIQEPALGPDHPDVALTLSELAALLTQTGDYERAARLGERALAIHEDTLGPDHPNVASALSQLATLHLYLGEYDRAAPLYERSLAILDDALGPEHPEVALALSNLAIAYYYLGEHALATERFERALALEEEALGPDHPSVAISLNHVGNMYGEQGEYARAQPMFERALAIQEAALGPDHPDVAVTLTNLATLHHRLGQAERALPLLERTLAIQESALGPDHPDVAFSLAELAVVHRALGDLERAGDGWERNSAIREKNLQILLATGSEDDKRARLASLREETHGIVSFHQRDAPGDPRAARLALETILRRKGRVLDAMADTVEALRQSLDDPARDLLDQLGQVRSELATHILGGPGDDPAAFRSRSRELRARLEALEAALGARSHRHGAASAAVTVDDVQVHLAADAALVELFRYQPYAPREVEGTRQDLWQAPRYAAYVLGPEGPPRAVDLGEAAAIDALVDAWRAALRTQQPAARDHARALDARVMAPVRALLGDAGHVFIAPDGALHLIPFAALVDQDGRYLIERYHITYVTSGRDLARPASPVSARQGPVVVASPRFGAARPRDAGAQPASAVALQGLQVPPLPGTAREARALAGRLAEVEVWTGAQATEARVRGVRGPVLLHIATHGVWLQDSVAVPLGSQASAPAAGPAPLIPDPMLRSGLALAGFNARKSGADDGLLTALEVASLDLHGTELVVLSACDTGLGEVKSGQGVYGLRRALVVAGARTQVMSLWDIDDAATRDLMVAYYRRLLAGEGRSQAMRQAQLALLRRDRTAHPYFWAGFVVAGDPSPMTGLVPRPRERAGGCSALAARTGPAWPAGLVAGLAALAAVAVLRRRRHTPGVRW